MNRINTRKGPEMGSERSEAEGLKMVGRFGGVAEGDPPAILIDYDYRGADGKVATATRRLAYSAYNSRTGELTPVGDALGDLKEGDPVAVHVWVNARGGTVTFRAMAVERLAESVPASSFAS